MFCRLGPEAGCWPKPAIRSCSHGALPAQLLMAHISGLKFRWPGSLAHRSGYTSIGPLGGSAESHSPTRIPSHTHRYALWPRAKSVKHLTPLCNVSSFYTFLYLLSPFPHLRLPSWTTLSTHTRLLMTLLTQQGSARQSKMNYQHNGTRTGVTVYG